MNKLSQYLVEGILNEVEEGITVMLPGGFKPPHEGHYQLAKGYADMPQVKEVVILIGPKDRDGITVENSEKIWDMLIGGDRNIRVQRSKYPSPLLTAYKYVEEEAQQGETYALGSSSKGSDYDRIRGFVDQHQEDGKYYKPGVSVVELPLERSKPIIYKGRTDGENGKPMSASQLRADLAANDFENFKANYPSITSPQQLQTIFDMLVKKKTNEDGAGLFRSTLDEGLSSKVKQGLKTVWRKGGDLVDKIKTAAKRERAETKKAIEILGKMIKHDDVSDQEKTFFKAQAKDVAKIIPLIAIQGIPAPIPITPLLIVLGKKYGFDPLPSSHKTVALDDLQELMRFSESIPTIKPKTLLTEGGAAGHMAHPYEDMDMTFDDIEDMIDAALSGKIEYAQEKLDGQNLMMTYKDGQPLAARRQTQLRNASETAFTKTEFEKVNEKYPDNIKLSFNEAFADMGKAMEKLSPAEKEEFFGNGTKYVNFEILHPASANAVAYGVTELRLHNIQEYDENGNVKGTDIQAAKKLDQALKQVEAESQDTYDIKSTDLLSLKQTKDYEKQKEELLKDLNNVRNKYQLAKGDKLGLYFQNFWSSFIKNNAKTYKYDIPDNVLQNLINRWAFGIKNPRIPQLKKEIDNPEFSNWVTTFDKGSNVNDQKKVAVEPVSDIFLKLGVFVLESMEGLIAINPNDIVANTKKELASAIEQIKQQAKNGKMQDDDAPLRFLKSELKRIEKAGGFEKIVPTEGVVFKHKDKIYKLTGTFAPVNQIIGYIKFGR